MQGTPTPEKALKKLQQLVRQHTKPDPRASFARSLRVPDELASNDIKMINFTREEYTATKVARVALDVDLRFEYLEDNERDKVLDYFICQSVIDPKKDYIKDFIKQYAREPLDITVYMPIEHLEITQSYSFGNIRLLPPDTRELSGTEIPSHEPITGLAATIIKGTDTDKMRDRAYDLIERDLGVLRVGLRKHPAIAYSQLRFRVGRGFAFSDGRTGWQEQESTGHGLGISEELLQLVNDQPIASLLSGSSTKLEKKVTLAVSWLEQAQLATDPLMGIALSMFALEALLGEKSEGLKGYALAFRRALLSSIQVGHYADPNTTYYLYDSVRSYMVHGEEVPEVTTDMHTSLMWDVRLGINEYLEVARANKFTRPSQMIKYLNEHDEAQKLLDWLQQLDKDWLGYSLPKP